MGAVEQWGGWFLLALFGAILTWEEVWDLPNSAALSAWLLLLITAGAMVCSWYVALAPSQHRPPPPRPPPSHLLCHGTYGQSKTLPGLCFVNGMQNCPCSVTLIQ